MVSERIYRRTNQRWAGAELDRLLRSVKLEDVTPPLERFHAIAASLQRSPQSARAKWLEVRNAGIRGQHAVSPAVSAYVARRFPQPQERHSDMESLDSLVAAYRAAQSRADALLERVLALAARNDEALSELRRTLNGIVEPRMEASMATEEPDLAELVPAGEPSLMDQDRPAA